MGERDAYRVFGGEDLREINNFDYLDIDGRLILKWILKWDGEAWTGLIWLRIRTGGVHL
jgi:hypothetical protein